MSESLAVQRRASGGSSEMVASILRNIGTVLFEMDHFERAERTYEEALVIYERELGAGVSLSGDGAGRLARRMRRGAI